MAARKEPSSDESIDLDPYISNTRTYSDFILYFVNTGRFQHNSLLDHERRKGVLTLLQSERVIKLTRERRLSPVNVAMTPGGRKQRLYMVAIVRSGVGAKELDKLVAMMNQHLEEIPMDEREQAVVDLIFSTGSRVIPGIRYLPLHWYPTMADTPPEVILDDENRRVDEDGNPVMDTDEETVAIVHSDAPAKRNCHDVPMPSATAVLSDASTDSGRGPGTYKKKRKVPPHEWPSFQDEDDENEPDVKRPKPEEEHRQVPDDPRPSTSFDPDDVEVIDDDNKSVEVLSEGGQEIITREELQRELSRVVSGFGELKQFVQQLAEQKGKSTSGVTTSQAPSTKAKTMTRDDTPEYVNDAESSVLALFPINYYSKAIDWLIRQPIVHDLIYYEVMRIAYRKLPVFKPDSNQILEAFMDAILSVRLQTHMGKPTPRATNHDYGRFTMPMVFLRIAQDKLAGLGRLRAPGVKDVADFLKDRCAGYRRTKVICGPFMAGSESVQQLAHRILNERVDFAQKHKWLFDKAQEKKWTFSTELKKTRKLETSKKFPEDGQFDGDKVPFEEDIEYLIFSEMDKGQELDDMEVAKKLVSDLEERGITKPTFPKHVWDTIKMIVPPSPLDLANAKKVQEKKAATRTARLARRRDKYAKKKGQEAVDVEEELSEGEEVLPYDPTTEDEQVDEPDSETHEPQSSGTYQMDPLTRQDHIRGLFGSVSDVSSDNSKGSNENVPEVTYNINKEGVMQFTEPPVPGTSKDVGQEIQPAAPMTTDVPEPLASADILKAAEASGLVQDGSSVIVACDQNASTNSEFSIVIRSPTDNEPTVVTRESNQTTTVKETLTKPAPEKTAIQKYQDMEESALDQAALEGLPSSSSSSNEGAPMPHGGQAEDANGQVIAGAITPEAIFKTPYPVTKVFIAKTAKDSKAPKAPKATQKPNPSKHDDDMADFKAPFKPPRPIDSKSNVQGHRHGTRSKSKAAKKDTKQKKGQSKKSKK